MITIYVDELKAIIKCFEDRKGNDLLNAHIVTYANGDTLKVLRNT